MTHKGASESFIASRLGWSRLRLQRYLDANKIELVKKTSKVPKSKTRKEIYEELKHEIAARAINDGMLPIGNSNNGRLP